MARHQHAINTPYTGGFSLYFGTYTPTRRFSQLAAVLYYI
jgi:hypothetical protein